VIIIITRIIIKEISLFIPRTKVVSSAVDLDVAGGAVQLVTLGLGGLLGQVLFAIRADETLRVALLPQDGQRIAVDRLQAVTAHGTLALVETHLALGPAIHLKGLSVNGCRASLELTKKKKKKKRKEERKV